MSTRETWRRDEYGNATFAAFMLTLCSAIVAVCIIVFLAVVLVGRSVGRTTCENWSIETGIESKFVLLNWADTGTCLAKAPDGRWILNSNWQAFFQADR